MEVFGVPSCLYQSFQEVLLHHLLDLVSGSAPEHLLALVLGVSRGVGRVPGRGSAEERHRPETRLAAEHLAEHGEEGQELLHATDTEEGQSQASRLPR